MKVQAIVLQLNSDTNSEALQQLIESFGSEVVRALPTTWLVKSDTPSYDITSALRPLLSAGEHALVMGVSPTSVISMAPDIPAVVLAWLQANF